MHPPTPNQLLISMFSNFNYQSAPPYRWHQEDENMIKRSRQQHQPVITSPSYHHLCLSAQSNHITITITITTIFLTELEIVKRYCNGISFAIA